MTTDEIAARVLALDKAATPGPWLYRPYKHDDWGLVRSSIPDPELKELGFDYGPAVTGIAGMTNEELQEHREKGTDPCGPNAVLIAAYRTFAPELARAWQAQVAKVTRLREALKRYKHCRHACIDCFCEKEARAALAGEGGGT